MTSGGCGLDGVEGFLAVADDRDDEAGALQCEAGDELNVEIVFSQDDGQTHVAAGAASVLPASAQQ